LNRYLKLFGRIENLFDEDYEDGIGFTENVKYQEMKKILEAMDIRINKIFFHDSSLKDIYELPRACLNITEFPMPWIDRMKARFDMDFFVTSSVDKLDEATELMPLGIRESASIFTRIAQLLGKKKKAAAVLEPRIRDAEQRLKAEAEPLKGKRFAVVGGFLMSMVGLIMVKDLGMKAELLIYKTRGLESHGMGQDAITEMVDRDRNTSEGYGMNPAALINPSHQEEIDAIRASGAEIVIASRADLFRYHQAGIKTFDSSKFFTDVSSIGFECPIRLATILKKELERTVQNHPLLSMLDYEEHQPTLSSHWVRLSNVWRAVTEGADGGCLYG